MFDIDWMSLALPFAYIGVLGAQNANLEPWFPPHLQRNIYLTLLHMEPEPGQEKAPKVPDSVIRAALLRRAVEDIRRIIQIRTSKQALNSLLQRGSVGEDLNQRFLRAEKEIEEELRDVVTEVKTGRWISFPKRIHANFIQANALSPGWGQTIFQSANEIAANTLLRTRLEEIESRAEADKEWWEKRRETIQKDFMRELEEDSSTKGSVKGSDDDAVLVDSGSPTTPSKKKKGKK
ncbi:hypothetical protein Daesc_004408 [Daldinia eschscholtzii]|uniref:Uncharacterized protein n=1 Tax=Daldinia eschscholtzii TaxID=292717 RepID=A0AAX6MQI4_9PEZI